MAFAQFRNIEYKPASLQILGALLTSLPTDFDPSVYLKLNPDLVAAGVEPYGHYIQFGASEGRRYRLGFSAKDKERLIATGLFDPEFYIDTYLDGDRAIDPAEHYLSAGGSGGFWASLYFRSNWYQEQAGLNGSETNPLFHYLDYGSARGLEPNPFFEPEYYSKKYADDLKGEEPLVHFAREGHRGFNPSPRFDAARYIKENPDALGQNPLLHYLQTGLPEGRMIYRAEAPDQFEALESAALEIEHLKPLTKRVALLVTHFRDHVKPHTAYYADALRSAGFSVVLIAAHDKPVHVDLYTKDCCSVIVARENRGFDFAAWAHALQAIPDLWDADEILLTNDSIAGPVGHGGLSKLISRMAEKTADIIGATSNFEHAEHAQSFFLLLRKPALRSPALRAFFAEVVNLRDKNHVIREYEIPLTPRARASGLKVDVLFPPYRADQNASIFHWRELLRDGFPFIKMALLTGPQSRLFGEDPLRAMAVAGYPTQFVVSQPRVPLAPPSGVSSIRGRARRFLFGWLHKGLS